MLCHWSSPILKAVRCFNWADGSVFHFCRGALNVANDPRLPEPDDDMAKALIRNLFSFRPVCLTPFAHGEQNRAERLATCNEGIFYFGRNLFVDRAPNDPVFLQLAQLLGEHLAAGLRNLAGQFARPRRAIENEE